MNQPFKYEFNEVKFYDYTIRMTVINDTEMYLVSDLLKQYNKINHTDKRIRDWIKRKDTEELLQFCRNKKSFGIFASSKNNEDDYVNIPNVIMKIDYKINNNITVRPFQRSAQLIYHCGKTDIIPCRLKPVRSFYKK